MSPSTDRCFELLTPAEKGAKGSSSRGDKGCSELSTLGWRSLVERIEWGLLTRNWARQ
jgi:hypothetical protein